MKRFLPILLCLLFPAVVFGHGGVDAAKRSVQASMLVTGLIAVNPDGSVYGYSLDQRDKLPAEVVRLIGDTLPEWKFEPIKVDGKPVLAKALMSLRVVANQTKPGHYVASVAGAAFGDDIAQSRNSPGCARDDCLSYLRRPPPTYPTDLLRHGVTGTVYVLVAVNRQGRVAQADVRQVNLRGLADETQLGRWRRELGEVSLRAARRWTFSIPKTGKRAEQQQWIVTVPINYSIRANGKHFGDRDYGQWDAYVPGPVHPIPWAQTGEKRRALNGSPDAIPSDGSPFVPDTRFVLLTPFVKSSDASAGAGQPQNAGNSGQG